MKLLNIYRLGARLHEDQTDKAGRPYIEHLTRVFLRVQAEGGDENQQIAALLHDCIEDGHTTAVDLALNADIPQDAVDLVVVLTRRKDQTYMEYLAGVKSVPRAVLVKMADLEDNGSLARLALLPEKEAQRLRKKYNQAMRFLLE